MNLSGRAVKSALEQYDFALNELLVICDDLSLPFGKIRVRAQGSAGGHNGLNSIIEAVGSNEFGRVRLGIFPGVEISDAAEYVLSPIGERFERLASAMVEQASHAVLMIAQQGLVPAMNYFNSLSVPEKIEET
jgi:PTH1 family peptidyl-tRNA hydrolase